jgi:ribonuclease BN (tRNA processing enzyme)
MKIHFLGTGSAFTLKNFHSNYLIESNNKFLLIDAGSDIRFSLNNMKKSYKDIDSVYISHLHGDHVGGIEYLGFTSYFDQTKEKIKLFANHTVMKDILPKGMESLQMQEANIKTYFDINKIRDNSTFEWEGLICKPIQSVHIMNGFTTIPSFGLMITNKETNKTVYFTTDTQYCPHQLKDFMKMANLIILDCETTPYNSGVHGNFNEWKEFPQSLKSKFLMTHYQDNVLSEDGFYISDEWYVKAKEAGFIGFALKGTSIDEGEIE